MTVYIIVFIVIIIYVFNGFWNLLKSFSFLKKGSVNFNKNLIKSANNKSEQKIIILMPVLREQEVIVKNLNIFTRLKGNYELVYITTRKEDDEKIERYNMLLSLKKRLLNSQSETNFIENLVGIIPYSIARDLYHDKNIIKDAEKNWQHIIGTYLGLDTTAEIIDGYLEKNKQYCSHVHRINYPHKDGVMSHQLNYACKRILKNHNPNETFILIYNADSVIEKNALDVFIEKIKSGEKVIMQSSLFLENYDSFSENFRGSILSCIALAQSRWTLVHEINRIRAQYNQGVKSIYESAHVVGHGTCIRLDKLLTVGGFLENFINEDLPLGYFLALSGEKICPVAVLENSQSPSTVSSVITQYTTWFYGAMDYFLYYRYAVNILKFSRYKALLWSIVNSIRAAMWLLAPWIWIGLIAYPIFFKRPLLSIIAFAIFLFHTVFVYWLIILFVRKNPSILGKENFSITFKFKIIITAPVAYIIWGIGPIKSFIQVMIARVLRKKIYKKKTER
jgi:hypothetical protein